MFKVETPVLYISPEELAKHYGTMTNIGMIVEVCKNSSYPYRIIFDNGENDWFTDVNRDVTKMVNNYAGVLSGKEIPSG